MLPLDNTAWVIVAFCSLLVGLSKTGLPGAGVLAVPLVACVVPARESTGFLLPILVAADIMAIIYWRRNVDRQKLIRLLPWTLAGIVGGYFGLRFISSSGLMPVIGLIVLAMLGLTRWRSSLPGQKWEIPTSRWFAAATGILAGSTSMMANAAGPIMVVYMLAMKMEKKELIGTMAWFFWIVNLTKVPFSGSLNLITIESLTTDLVLLPFILAGGVAGIFLVHRLPQEIFNRIIEILAAATALYLCVKPLF